MLSIHLQGFSKALTDFLFPVSYIPVNQFINNKKYTMGTIEDNRKFKRKEEQSNPTNPTGNTNIDTNKFDIDEKTIKDQQNKK